MKSYMIIQYKVLFEDLQIYDCCHDSNIIS